MPEARPESRSFRWLLYAVAVPAGLVGTAFLLFTVSLSTGWPIHQAEGLDLIFRTSCRAECELEEDALCRERCDCMARTLRERRSDDEYAAFFVDADEEAQARAFEEVAEFCVDSDEATEPVPVP